MADAPHIGLLRRAHRRTLSIRLTHLFDKTGIMHGTLIQVTLVRSLRSNALTAFSIARMIRYVSRLCDALKTS